MPPAFTDNLNLTTIIIYQKRGIIGAHKGSVASLRRYWLTNDIVNPEYLQEGLILLSGVSVGQQVGLQYNCSKGKQFQIDSMRQASTSSTVTSYLDVSQFILKEPSPLIKPSSPSHHTHPHQVTPLSRARFFSELSPSPSRQSRLNLPARLHSPPSITQIPRTQHTPEIAPIDHDPTGFMLTPLAGALSYPEPEDLLDDFVLDSGPATPKPSRRRSRRTPSSPLGLAIFRLDCELERIVEDDCENSEAESQLSSHSDSEEPSEEEDLGNTLSSCGFSQWALRVKSRDYSLKDHSEEQQSTIDISLVDYTEAINRFARNPKLDILRKMKEVEAMEGEESDRRALLKKFLEKYLLDYEVHCFEEAWQELGQGLVSTIKTLTQGLDETFAKRIGCLPFEARRVKLLKYLQKKKRRIWRKKVSYDCRKKVADGRLRIKGKFVTREQACEQLGLESLDNYSAQQIKEMLQRRMDELTQLVC